MLKGKLNSNELNDINGGIDLREVEEEDIFSIDDNLLLQAIKNDTNLKETINSLLNLDRYQTANLIHALDFYSYNIGKPYIEEKLEEAQNNLFSYAKQNPKLAYELAHHYGIV